MFIMTCVSWPNPDWGGGRKKRKNELDTNRLILCKWNLQLILSPVLWRPCFILLKRARKSDISVQLREPNEPKTKSQRGTSGWQTQRNVTPANWPCCVYSGTGCPLPSENTFQGWKWTVCAKKVWGDNAACSPWNSPRPSMGGPWWAKRDL